MKRQLVRRVGTAAAHADGANHLLRDHCIGLFCTHGEGEVIDGFDLAQFGLVPRLDGGFHGRVLVVKSAAVNGLHVRGRRSQLLSRQPRLLFKGWQKPRCMSSKPYMQ